MLTNREANGHLYLATSPSGGGGDEKIRMTILSDGDIGIGTLTPNLSGMGNSTNKAKVLTLDATGNGDGIAGMEFNSNRPNDGWGLGIIKFLHNSNTLSDFYATREAGGTRSAFIFRSTDGADLVERMRLDENGKLGIGTAEPSNLLHVSHDNGHQLLRLTRISTSSTGNDLNFDVASGSGLANIVAGAEKAADTGEDYQYTGTRGASRIRLHDGLINFYTSDLTNGTANTNVTWHNPINFIGDKVGIGTDDPQAELHLNGEMRLNHIKMNAAADDGGSRYLEMRTEASNKRTVLRLIPNGSLASTPTALTLFGTDYTANSNNWERLIVRAGGTNSNDYQIQTEAGGSGEIRPLHIRTGSDNTGIYITEDGKVGIGTTNPYSKFAVEGEMRAVEVNVMPDITIPDYVFEPDYELRSLEQVKAYVQQHKHLPEIPSAAEIEAEGMPVGKMNALLLKKIEELTLYQIEQHQTIEQQNALLQQLLQQNEALLERVEELERND